MSIRVTQEQFDRARKAADSAPSGLGFATKVTRRSFPPGAVTWAVQGPHDLLRLLQDAERLQREAERAEDVGRKTQETGNALRQTLLGELEQHKGDHPDLVGAAEEALEAGPTDHDQGDTAAAIVATFRERDRLRKTLRGLEQEINQGPADERLAKQELERSCSQAQAEIAALEKRLEAGRHRAMQVSGEHEQIEHTLAEARRALRDLMNEARVFTATVEQIQPATARRLYHLFREAAYYREYKRDAEEAKRQAEQAEAARRQLIDEYNALVERYNSQLGEHQRLASDWDDLYTEVESMRNALQQGEAQIFRLDEELSAAWKERAVAYAMGRPVSDIPRAATVTALVNGGILTYGQLAERSEEEIRALHGVGDAGIQAIRRSLADVNLGLRDSNGTDSAW